MTVSEKQQRKRINATGFANPLTHDVYLESSAHLKVYADTTLLAIGTDYTVSETMNPAGYEVDIVIPVPGSEPAWWGPAFFILSVEPPIEQADDVSLGGQFGLRFELSLDNLARRVQHLADRTLRALKMPRTTSTAVEYEVPAPVASKVIGWNADADGLELYDNLDTVAADAAASAAAADASADAAAAAAASVTGPVAAAAASAAAALVSENAADASADAAAASAIAAAASAVLADASADAAVVSAAEADADRVTVAADKGIVAADKATVAADKATVAADKATTSGYKTDAQAAQTAAAAAQVAAEAALASTLSAYDSFDDRYLGAKAADPALDNDGNALAAGMIYYNSVSGAMLVYTGSAWVAAYVSGSGYLATANNLSDVANAGTARTNLGLAIGANVQAYDATLAALAALGTAADKLAYTTGINTWEETALTAAGRAILDDASASAQRTTLGLVIGADVQAYSANLTNVREVLTAARTYYVRTDGSNSNTGLADSAGGAFLTLQKAWDVAASLDLSIYSVTVQVRDGTYTGGINATTAPVGGGSVTIQGNSGTPSNVVISTTSADAFKFNGIYVNVLVKDLKAQTTTSGYGIQVDGPGINVSWQNMVFGACANDHIYLTSGASGVVTGNYSITGAATSHIRLNRGALLASSSRTVTTTGTLNFANGFIRADAAAQASYFSSSFTGGTVTGARYVLTLLGGVNTFGGGASYFPGDAAGTTATGAQYA